MCRRELWSGLLILAAGLSPAATQAAEQGQRLWDLQADVLSLEASLEALQSELDRVPQPSPSHPGENLDAALRKYLSDVLGSSQLLEKKRQEAEGHLRSLLKALGQEGDRLTNSCRQSYQRNLRVRQQTKELEAWCECSLGEVPPFLSLIARMRLCLWGGLAFLVGLLLAQRKLWRQGRRNPTALGWLFRSLLGLVHLVVLGAALCLILMGQPRALLPLFTATPEPIEQAEDARLREEKAKLHDDIAAVEQTLKDRRRKLDESRARRASLDADTLHSLEGTVAEKLHQSLVQTRLNQKLRDKEETLRRVADKEEQALTNQHQYADWLRQRGWLRAGLCLLIGMVAALPWLAVTVTGGRRKPVWQCPCCEETRKPRPAGGEGNETAVPRHVCACGHALPSHTHTNLPQLCFPLFGRKQSGKTHWMIEFQHQAANVQGGCLQPLPSAAMAQVEKAVEALWVRRTGPAPTAYADNRVPDPLVFHLREPGAGEEALVHLFDCAGNMADLPMVSPARRRALHMDGTLLFLDATQPWATQQEMLNNFVSDLRKRRNLRAGSPIPVPLAVCLSRLDLVAGIEGVAQLLDTIRLRVDLALLQERSRLIEAKLEELFPGSSISQQLQREFGENHLFFPCTPVGLEGDGLPGAVGLRERSLVPFGIVEPVLWLLHRHGYQVFD